MSLSACMCRTVCAPTSTVNNLLKPGMCRTLRAPTSTVNSLLKPGMCGTPHAPTSTMISLPCVASKKLRMVELTVPFKTGFQAAAERKENYYRGYD